MPVPLLSHMVADAGFEPAICTLKGYRVTPIPLIRHIASSFIFYLPKEGLIYKNHSPTIVAGHGLATLRGVEPRSSDRQSDIIAVIPQSRIGAFHGTRTHNRLLTGQMHYHCAKKAFYRTFFPMHRLTPHELVRRITPVSLRVEVSPIGCRRRNRTDVSELMRLVREPTPFPAISIFIHILYRNFSEKSNFEVLSGLLGRPP